MVLKIDTNFIGIDCNPNKQKYTCILSLNVLIISSTFWQSLLLQIKSSFIIRNLKLN